MNNPTIQDIKARYHIVGRDEKLERALDTALQVARTDLSVLIQGESGVGKEIIPRIIHDQSPRKRGRYIAINCGSIPEGTIDSELFGHERGSYTGAIDEREGYFGAADGGTLFLDEVGELPMTTQARLLRVLETGEYIRVGSDQPRKTDVRIVAATNVDIPSAIREGRFREDLYYRLCTINIKMPPLRERGIDSVLLFKMFAMDTAQQYRIPEPIRLNAEAEQVVMTYKWPGNIRQLKNIVQNLSIMERGVQITPAILERYGIVAGQGESHSLRRISGRGSEGGMHDYENEIKWLMGAVLQLRKEVEALKATYHMGSHERHAPLQIEDHSYQPAVQEYTQSESGTPVETTEPQHIVIQTSTPGPQRTDYDDAYEVTIDDSLNLEEMERRNIILALQKTHNRRKAAAQLLGISERTLFRKIKDYGIEE